MKLASIFATTLLFAGLQSQAAISSKPVTGEAIARTRLALASQLIQAYDIDLTCDVGAFPTEINTTIRAALELARPGDVASFLKRIPAKSKIRSDLAFLISAQVVKFNNVNETEAGFAKKIQGTKFYAFGNGVYGSPKNVTLLANGVAEINTLEVLQDEPYTKWNTTQGKWAVKSVTTSGGPNFVLTVDGTDFQINEKYESGYEIWLEPVDRVPADQTDFARTLSSSPSLCEAYY